MNPIWTFLSQSHLFEVCENQDAGYGQFFQEDDALDATWEDLYVPSDDLYPISENTIGFGADPDMVLGCVCDFPALDCAQHGAHGGMPTSSEPSPSPFVTEQTTASFNDDNEPLAHGPGLSQLTEGNLMDQPLCLDSIEIGQVDPNMSTNDQSSFNHVYQDHRRSSTVPEKQQSQRSKITTKERRKLKAYFSTNPYPDDRELRMLRKRTGLSEKCIKTWFGNTRHRTAHGRYQISSSPQETCERQVSETALQASMSVSTESLRQLDRMSPADSTSSLERYLATPLREEALPSATIESLSETCFTTGGSPETESMEKRQPELERQSWIVPDTGLLLGAQISKRSRVDEAGSVVGSDSSIDSGNSARSWTSQTSVDSRGSRRGRKSWVPTPNQSTAIASFKTKSKKPVTAEQSKRPWYCTWPDCNKAFQYRYEWDRHEVAVHYWPYHWVCNLGEETSTVHKDASSRIFFRQDQLLVHMKGAHPETRVTKDSASALKKDNPSFNPASLRCGFCHRDLGNWEERQDHVSAHLQEGKPKFAWLCWNLLPCSQAGHNPVTPTVVA